MVLIRRILLSVMVVLPLMTAGCGSSSARMPEGTSVSDTGKARIIFREYEHHFGKVPEGEKIGCVFIFDNTGTADLVISSALATCGCTVAEYDSKPIAPGKNGKVEVVFNTSGRNGMQSKTITVRSNAKPPVVLLKITAEVTEENSR